ncbi:NAD(P)-binding protein [Achaetomium macrosporum]|uniref:NAD(P)-binding protein n=1 Tax=Achaetomium macrosporum TaxID=79813 RepID=A0AAN7HAP4_9PEZI|nr:NAD(P)-binding protein [Achaetomium macrosporum]
MGGVFTQFFPPKPTFTERDVPDLSGKVYIVTGSNTGIGYGLAGLLYARNASVYIAARSQEKANAAIEKLKAASRSSTGSLTYMHLDLSDLSTIQASVNFFLARESKLHVLFNNAGVMNVAAGQEKAKTRQGHEIHMGVNCLGPFLLTMLLTPVLSATAKTEPAGCSAVRVVWVSSTIDVAGKRDVGLELDNLDYEKRPVLAMNRYGYSKVGNYFQGVEYARRVGRSAGVVSVAVNPGNLCSELYREHGTAFTLFTKLITYPPINGSYTLLYAGLSPDVTLEKSGNFIIPFGRIKAPRKDLEMAAKPESEGGNGTGPKFWEWCEAQVKPYL